MKKLFVVAFFLLGSLALNAQTPEIKPSTLFSFSTDQDFFSIPESNNDDRNYTMGAALEFSNPKFERLWTHRPFSALAGFLSEKELFGSTILPYNTQHFASSFGILGSAFTPDSLSSIPPRIGDRPYAFLLGFTTRSVFLSLSEKQRYRFYSMGINYGWFGSYVGREAQTWIHTHIVDSPIPRGWNNQIGQGGAFTLLLDYNYFQSFRKNLKKPGDNLTSQCNADGAWQLGGSVGYYNRIYGSVGGRIGLIDYEDVYNWFNSFNSLSTAAFQQDENPSELSNARTELFLFGQVNGQFMIRNSMLEGTLFGSDVYVLDRAWIRPFTFELVQGIGFSRKWYSAKRNRIKSFSFQFRNVQRSPEFSSGILPPRWHYYGSLAFIFSIGA